MWAVVGSLGEGVGVHRAEDGPAAGVDNGDDNLGPARRVEDDAVHGRSRTRHVHTFAGAICLHRHSVLGRPERERAPARRGPLVPHPRGSLQTNRTGLLRGRMDVGVGGPVRRALARVFDGVVMVVVGA